jgi:hypothetical protein
MTIDVFSVALGAVSNSVIVAAISRMLWSPKKVWDENYLAFDENEKIVDYDELQKSKPHFWMDE